MNELMYKEKPYFGHSLTAEAHRPETYRWLDELNVLAYLEPLALPVVREELQTILAAHYLSPGEAAVTRTLEARTISPKFRRYTEIVSIRDLVEGVYSKKNEEWICHPCGLKTTKVKEVIKTLHDRAIFSEVTIAAKRGGRYLAFHPFPKDILYDTIVSAVGTLPYSEPRLWPYEIVAWRGDNIPYSGRGQDLSLRNGTLLRYYTTHENGMALVAKIQIRERTMVGIKAKPGDDIEQRHGQWDLKGGLMLVDLRHLSRATVEEKKQAGVTPREPRNVYIMYRSVALSSLRTTLFRPYENGVLVAVDYISDHANAL